MNRIGFDLKRIDPKYYSIVTDNTLEVGEASQDGAACIRVVFQSEGKREFIQLLQEQTSWLQYIVNQKCADGIIIDIDATNRARCNLYIFELKRTVNADKWTGDIKAQFRGATLRAMAFLSTLGVTQIDRQEYFTGFVHNHMGQSIDAVKAKQHINPSSPIAKKGFVGRRTKDHEILEWEQEEIEVFQSRYAHRKIELALDEQNVGIAEIII